MTSKGTSQAGTLGQPPTALRATRASSRQTTITPPNGGIASPVDKGKKGEKRQTAGEQSRQVLINAKCLGPDEQVAPSTMYKLFDRILHKYAEGLNIDARVALQAFATLLQEGENQTQLSNKIADEIARRVESKLEGVLDSGLLKMSDLVDNVLINQRELQGATATLTDKTEALQSLAQEIGNSAKEASATTDQISSTMTSYKEALLTVATNTPRVNATQTTKVSEDPRLTRDLDRKSRQLLIELGKETVESKSASEIKEKLETALKSLDPSPPEGAIIQEINKLRNGGVIIQLATKVAADWLREPFNKVAFTEKLDAHAYIKERMYPLVVPRVPISFDPLNQEHLREVEAINNLAPHTVSKARWIKPIYRRHAKQTVAYATLSLNSAIEANRLIRDGMYICSNRTYPKRLKYEPKQCMKCRKWGHFASECQAKLDTCGTCGENHVTKDCVDKGKRYCVACKATDHASWDRSCPEFQRKIAQFDEIHPENALTYFPTEESWTLTARPERVPLGERFPSRFAVGSLPPPSHAKRAPPTREIARKQKHKRRNVDNNQNTLDGYLETREHKDQEQNAEPSEEGQIDKDDEDVADMLILNAPGTWIQ